MLTLYYKPTCPFCRYVLTHAEQMGIELELKDVTTDDEVSEMLLSLGGKRQVPFLVDAENAVQMYESEDIVKYLRATYATPAPSSGASRPRVHFSDAACVSCEG